MKTACKYSVHVEAMCFIIQAMQKYIKYLEKGFNEYHQWKTGNIEFKGNMIVGHLLGTVQIEGLFHQ